MQEINLVVGFAHPELGALLHDVGEHAATQEHHVLPPRRVFDPDRGGGRKEKREEGERERCKAVQVKMKSNQKQRNDKGSGSEKQEIGGDKAESVLLNLLELELLQAGFVALEHLCSHD